MKFFVTSFIAPKEKMSQAECEDKSAYDIKTNFRFAVADSASNSSYSSAWAEMLVNDYVSQREVDLLARIEQLRQQWHDTIKWDSLAWQYREKALRGDRSTMLGLSFHPSGNDRGVWKAVAIGDSCLFQIRQDELIRSFPLQQSNEFNDHPALLSSIDKNIQYLHANMKTTKGNYRDSDLFLLATDAVAEWFLQSTEAGEKPWTELEKLETMEDFHDFMTDLRQKNRIKDDDLTILRILIRNIELMVT